MLQLRFINDAKPPIWLVAPEYTLGSGFENDCTLTHEGVCAQHAKIVVQGDEITLFRVDESASITVNEKALETSAKLSAGDLVLLGSAQLQVADPKIEKLQRESQAADQTTIRPSLSIADVNQSAASVWQLRPLNTTLATSESYELKGVMLLGRSKECDICIPASHLSRKHARFSVQADTLTLEDLKSSNGTYVNGVKVEHTALKHGDEIGFDTLKFRVESSTHLDDATTLRPALDETQISQAIHNTRVQRVSPQANQRKTPPVRPKARVRDSEAPIESDPMETVKFLLLAGVVVGAVAGLVWFLLT